MMEQPQLNTHNKEEYPPMHSAEHILNQTMVRLFGCERSKTNHIEKKKSKCDYVLPSCPTEEQLKTVEDEVNKVIAQHYDVCIEYITQKEAQGQFDLGRLPDDATQTLRIVKIGDYDACPCIGIHVANTSEIGTFKIISYDYEENRLRIRFKLI
ncbi:MAG: hypothetical protein RR220_05020 [Bacteroidaceae bacterium]